MYPGPLSPFASAAVTTKLLFVDTNGSLRSPASDSSSRRRVLAFGFSPSAVLLDAARRALFSSPRLVSSRPVPSRLVSADDASKSYSFRGETCGSSRARAAGVAERASALYCVCPRDISSLDILRILCTFCTHDRRINRNSMVISRFICTNLRIVCFNSSVITFSGNNYSCKSNLLFVTSLFKKKYVLIHYTIQRSYRVILQFKHSFAAPCQSRIVQ